MNRWSLFGLLAAILWVPVLEAQPRFRPPPNRIDPARLNEEEGRVLLERFRLSGIPDPFSFHFRLHHMPRRAPSVIHEGRLWGHWWGDSHDTRIRLNNRNETEAFDLLLQRGQNPRGWVWTGSEAEPLDAERLFEPFVENVAFTPFDLLMPFVHWEDWVYEGSRRLRGRPAHFYLLYPPDGDPRYEAISGVRILVDADFNALLQAEVLDAEGARLKTLRADSFRRVDDQWIVGRIDITDERTRDRTRFEVVAAAMDVALDESLFCPESLGKAPTQPPPSAFSHL